MGLSDRDYMQEHRRQQTGKKAAPPLGPIRIDALQRPAGRRQGPPDLSPSLWLIAVLLATAALAAWLSFTGYDLIGLIRRLLEPLAALTR